MMVDEIYSGSFSAYKAEEELLSSDNSILDTTVDWESLAPVEEEAPALAKPAAVVRVSTDQDIDSNGLADIIMAITKSTHPNRGSAGAWLIQENQTAKWGNLSTLNATSKIMGFGKTSSSKAVDDIYVYDAATNNLGAWVTDENGKVTGWKNVNKFNDNMNVLGLGDFNADGQTDVLLMSDYGDLGVWFTSGAKTGWKRFQSLGKEWHIAAIGDFNGDGRDDVALTHDAGFAGCYITQADGTVKWTNLDNIKSGQKIAGAGDFNGDGVDDILLQQGNYCGAWIVENGNAKGWMGLGSLGNGAVVEQIGDFNGDGVDDLRLRVDKAIGVQLVKGADKLEWHYYGSVGSEWSTSLASL